MGLPPNPPSLEPSVLIDTLPCVYPPLGTARSSDTICNGPDSPILSFLGFPFRVFPQSFKMRLLGEGFHTLINSGLFSSPTNVGHPRKNWKEKVQRGQYLLRMGLGSIISPSIDVEVKQPKVTGFPSMFLFALNMFNLLPQMSI